jgi:hypothetical protein
VRPGRDNCDLTGVYDDLWVWEAVNKGCMRNINAKYDIIIRNMLKDVMVRHIIYGNW